MIRAVLLAAGLIYATLGSLAEADFRDGMAAQGRGDPYASFLHLVRAEARFPLPYYTRELVAVAFDSANALPADIVLGPIDRGLKADPYSPNLNWLKTVQELRRGNLLAASESLATLERVGPHFPETENARQVYAAVSAGIAQQMGLP